MKTKLTGGVLGDAIALASVAGIGIGSGILFGIESVALAVSAAILAVVLTENVRGR